MKTKNTYKGALINNNTIKTLTLTLTDTASQEAGPDPNTAVIS